jgi:hypothetical protein
MREQTYRKLLQENGVKLTIKFHLLKVLTPQNLLLKILGSLHAYLVQVQLVMGCVARHSAASGKQFYSSIIEACMYSMKTRRYPIRSLS